MIPLSVSYLPGISSRPTFERKVILREVEIIRRDLHCNAIRLNGTDLDRLSYAGECDIDQGLQVWLLPKYVDLPSQEALPYLAEVIRLVETLRQRSPQVVLIPGSEVTLFMPGILEGSNILDSIGNQSN